MKSERSYPKALGQTIKALRGSRTQAQIAEAAGVPTSTLSKIEQARHTPRDGTLTKIALALDLTLAELEEQVAACVLGVPATRAGRQPVAAVARPALVVASLDSQEPRPVRRDGNLVLRVGDSRVTLDTVSAAFDSGASAEEILYRYPSLPLVDIYAAITYLLRHRSAVDAYLGQRQEKATARRDEHAARFGLARLRQRLEAGSTGGAPAERPALPLAMDENLDQRLFQGLMRQRPDLDVVRIQDTECSGAEDAVVLSWAVRNSRILVTHDALTFTSADLGRIRTGGVVEIPPGVPQHQAVEELLLLIQSREWAGPVAYIPL